MAIFQSSVLSKYLNAQDNKLLDDPSVAGENAFDWNSEFPNVFKRGGFDVVIGQPPIFASTRVEREF